MTAQRKHIALVARGDEAGLAGQRIEKSSWVRTKNDRPLPHTNQSRRPIRLSAAIEERLAALAERTGRTKTFYAREAIEKHIDDLEDLYLAEAEPAKVRGGRSKPLPLAEVTKAHGLAG